MVTCQANRFVSMERDAPQRTRRFSIRTGAIIGVVAAALVGGCDLFPDAPPDNEILDGPIDGLSRAQVGRFMAGDEAFNKIMSPQEGVGPLFIASSCATCHPGDGRGHPVFSLTRFGRMEDGVFNPMRSYGGPQLQNRAVAGFEPERLPESATGVTRLIAPAVTGLGLLEAVDDATIIAMSDPHDEDGDGISGRVQRIDSSDFIADIISIEALVDDESSGRARFLPVDGRYIGRFGRKGLTISLLHQTVQAYIEDMGLTTDLVPQDLFNVQIGGFSTDDVPDPEITADVVNSVVFYLKTLRPPERRSSDDPDVMAGEQLFTEIGCAACHVPTLRTGRSEIAALNEVEFHPYTDLLLHDMGPELDDGYTEGIASTSEWRTPPLWGIGLAEQFQGGTAYYLHDGRATTLRDAIRYHGGEGAASRDAFGRLSETDQERLLQFLKSL